MANLVSAIDTTNLVAYYNLTDLAKDSSGNANDGTINGAVLNATGGILGASYRFDGNDDIDIPFTYANLSTKFAFNMWIKFDESVWADVQRFTGGQTANDDSFGISTADDYFVRMNDASYSFTSGSYVKNDTWQMVTFVKDGNNCDLYLNGSLYERISCANSGTAQNIRIANYFDGASGIKGQLDEISVWSVALDATNVSELWNSGTGFNPLAPVGGVLTTTIDLLFKSQTTGNYQTTFNESEDFLSYINFSLSTGQIINDTNATCFLNITNGTQDVDGLNQDVLIYGANTVSESFNLQYDNTTHVINQDYLLFKQLCKQGGNADLEVLVECGSFSANFDVPNVDMPTCPNNLTFYFKHLGTNCSGVKTVNATLSTNDVPILKAKQYHELEIVREHAYLVLNTTFNSTLQMFQASRDLEFYEHGTYPIIGNCSYSPDGTLNNSKTESVIIFNEPARIIFDGVNTSLGFTNATIPFEIEYAGGIWQWIGEIESPHSVLFNVTWYNSSGHIKQQNLSLTTSTTLETPDKLFADFQNNYSLYVSVWDGFNMSTANQSFIVNDTTSPTHNFEHVNVENNTVHVWNNLIQDEHLWELNLNCSEGVGYFNFTKTAIAATSYTFLNTTMNQITKNSTCSFNISDAHTKKGIRDLDVNLDLANNKIYFNEVWLETAEELNQISYNKKFDRYSMCFETKQDVYALHVSLPDHCVKHPSDEFVGWYVCGDKWVDFENDQGLSVSTVGTDVTITSLDKENTFCFNSIGSLNTVSGSITLTSFVSYDISSMPSSWSKEFDTNTTPGVLLLFFYFFVCLAVLLIGVFGKVPIIVMLAGMMFFFCGFVLTMSTSVLFGSFILFFGFLIAAIGVSMALLE